MRLYIDAESVTIDIGTKKEPIHIVYWHSDEWEEDATIVPSILNAIDLFYRDKKQLLDRLDFKYTPC